MKKSFAVIGLGRFGTSVAKELVRNQADVLAIDVERENVINIADYITNCAICNSTKKKALQELGVSSIDHAIVAIGNNLEASILTVINLKSLGVKEITVRVDDENYKEVFKTLGATSVIIPEEASAISLANKIISSNILDYYNVRENFSIVQLNVSTTFKARSLAKLDIRNSYNVNIVGIIRDERFFIPSGSDLVSPQDILLVIGDSSSIHKFDELLNGD